MSNIRGFRNGRKLDKWQSIGDIDEEIDDIDDDIEKLQERRAELEAKRAELKRFGFTEPSPELIRKLWTGDRASS